MFSKIRDSALKIYRSRISELKIIILANFYGFSSKGVLYLCRFSSLPCKLDSTAWSWHVWWRCSRSLRTSKTASLYRVISVKIWVALAPVCRLLRFVQISQFSIDKRSLFFSVFFEFLQRRVFLWFYCTLRSVALLYFSSGRWDRPSVSGQVRDYAQKCELRGKKNVREHPGRPRDDVI